MTGSKRFAPLVVLALLLIFITPALAETETNKGPFVSFGTDSCTVFAKRQTLFVQGAPADCNSLNYYYIRISAYGRSIILPLASQQTTSLGTGASQKPYLEFNEKVMKGELKFRSFDEYLNALQARGLIGNLTEQQRETIRATYNKITNNGKGQNN